MQHQYTIGLDYGTDSVRALVVDTQTGEAVGTAVHYYERWKKGLYCQPELSQFRQHPLDYVEGLEASIKGALQGLPSEVAANIVGISIDTTGSTPVAVDEQGTPLSLLPEFAENPHGMFILWKDHTANAEAEEINEVAHRWPIDYTKYVGGIYSSEWFWAKILRTLRVDEQVRARAFSWVEHCDWISAVLTGNTHPLEMKRSRCAAGHKAMWHNEFDGLPAEDFLVAIDPLLEGLRARLFQNSYTSDQAMGVISEEWAARLGLPNNVVIGVGAFDCHMGAVGAEIQPYDFVRGNGDFYLRYAYRSQRRNRSLVDSRYLWAGRWFDYPRNARNGGRSVGLRRLLCVVSEGHYRTCTHVVRRNCRRRARPKTDSISFGRSGKTARDGQRPRCARLG